MYTLSKKLKLSAIIFMVLGALLFAVDALNMPSTLADIEALHAGHGDDHGGGDSHAKETDHHKEDVHGTLNVHNSDTEEHSGGHEMTEEEHNQHLLDGYKNKPWSAVYIALRQVGLHCF